MILRLALAACVVLALVVVPQTAASAAASPDGWAAQATGTTSTLCGIWGSGPGDVFAVGENGTILHYDGAVWSPMDSGVSGILYGVWGSSSMDVFAVGETGVIRHYDGSGWTQMASGTNRQLQGVWGTDNANVYAVGYGGTILHFDGLSWSEMDNGNTSHLKSIWGSSASDVFAAGNNGVVVHYDGVAWSTMLEDTHPNFQGIWGSASDNVLAVGGEGMILGYDGVSWSPLSSGVSSELSGVWGVSPTDVFVVGLDGTILHYDGSAWVRMDGGVTGSLRSICGFSSINVFAAGYSGTILHFREMPPGVSAVSPGQANQGQALDVTISGSDLDTASAVSFGPGILVNNYCVDGPGQITASITVDAAAATGARDVSVSNPHGIAILEGAFTVPSPSAGGISPEHGDQGEMLEVTITGSNLGRTAGVALGDGISVSGFVVPDPTRVVATIIIDAGAMAGVRDVLVTTPEGTSVLAGGFRVDGDPPSLTAVSPSAGIQGQTLEVVISGVNLGEPTGVAFGDGVTVNNFAVDGPGSVAAAITIGAAAPLGMRDVAISTVDGSALLQNAFSVTAPAPTISDVSPRTGKVGQTLSLAITGANLAGVSNIDLGPGVVVEGYEAVAPDRITITVRLSWEAAVGARDVSVTTPGGTVTLSGGFTAYRLPPGIVGISPARGEPGQTLDIVISGVGFTGTTSVGFGEGVKVNGFTVEGDTRITANVTILDDGEGGPRDVRVETPVGSVDFTAGFDLAVDASSEDPPRRESTSGQSSEVPLVLFILGGVAVAAAASGVLLLIRRSKGGT